MDNEHLLSQTPAQLRLAVDRYNCYPNEQVSLYILLAPSQDKNIICQLSLPGVMEIEGYHLPAGLSQPSLSITELDQERILRIPVDKVSKAAVNYEIKVDVRINTFEIDQYLLCEAKLFDSDLNFLVSEAIQLAVFSRGRYMNHLPEIYESDHFINHFLMLIESFWKPSSQQIDQVYCYFDPLLTPAGFLPWLSSWIGMTFDERLPVDRKRKLLSSAMVMYQQRGTLESIKTYLKAYTDRDAEVIEKRSRNLILGGGSKLGVETALGKGNQSNTVKINIKVPDEDLAKMNYSKGMYLHKLTDTVRTLIPAHAYVDLNCEFIETETAI